MRRMFCVGVQPPMIAMFLTMPLLFFPKLCVLNLMIASWQIKEYFYLYFQCYY
ncbi:uncharacterized protein BJX67DRAFT_350063, partial [Aspergillus lucknowensis]